MAALDNDPCLEEISGEKKHIVRRGVRPNQLFSNVKRKKCGLLAGPHFFLFTGETADFLSEGARRQSYSAAVERFLSPHISSKDLASTNVSGGCFTMTGNSAARRQFQVMPKCPQDNSNHTQFYFKS